MDEDKGPVYEDAKGLMQITNISGGMVVFRIRLPSGKVYRMAIGSGETLGLSPAVQQGLPENNYFNQLVEAGKIRVEDATQEGC